MKRDMRAGFSLVSLAVVLCISVTFLGCEASPTSPEPSALAPPPPPAARANLGSAGSGGEVSAADDPVNACFSTKPNTLILTAKQSVALDARCTQSVSAEASFAWDLGDGRTENGSLVEVTYEQGGTFDIRLTVTDGRSSSSTTRTLQVNPEPVACFTIERPLAVGTKPCTVRVDASCSAGAIEEYEWFFEGGPAPPLSLPDVTVTTKGSVYEYSWAEDEFCHSFRPFERTIRLTVHDESGVTDTSEDVVFFSSPALKR